LRLLQDFRAWLGEGRFWLLIGMFISTGIFSFVLQFSELENGLALQNLLVLAFLVGALLIVGTRLPPELRLRWAAVLLPGIGLVLLGLFFFPNNIIAFIAGALGWVAVSMMLFGPQRAPMQYRDVVKAMRKNDYKTAVAAMDDLIKVEADVPNHYRFRAELLRLWGKLARARHDYQDMIEHSKDDANRAVGYNGLAEIDLQAKDYQEALVSAQKAYELAPEEWVTAYNLAMIADRLGDSDLVIDSLDKALEAKMPDSRHLLLVYLWQVRAYTRLNRLDDAQVALENMKNEKLGLKEWQNILPDEQAAVLRDVLEADVKLAEKLISEEIEAEKFAAIFEVDSASLRQ
jgi:tetratricopeptide (TPR) repeat protein